MLNVNLPVQQPAWIAFLHELWYEVHVRKLLKESHPAEELHENVAPNVLG